ncbi:MAG: trypsin-like peptidase domain-containing protein, partial [Myxococcota bacterium]
TMIAVFGAAAWGSTIAQCGDALDGDLEGVQRRTVTIGTTLGAGTGFFVSPDGAIVTAAHVVGGAATVTVTLGDGSTLPGKVVRRNADADLALITIQAGVATPCLPIGSARAKVGDELFIVGSAVGVLTHSVTKGIVSGWREVGDWTVLQTDASVNPGNSGGPVVDRSGAVQGIVTSKLVGAEVEGVGFALAADQLPEALDVAFGPATVGLDTGSAPAAIGPVVGPATVTNRPASPAPPLTGDVCKGSKVAASKVDGKRSIQSVDGLHQLSWSDGSPASLVVLVPVPVSEFTRLAQAASASSTTDLVLADGTHVALPEAPLVVAPGFGSAQIGARATIDLDLARVLASSPVAVVRLTGVGVETEFDKSDGKKLQAAAACLAMTAAAR